MISTFINEVLSFPTKYVNKTTFNCNHKKINVKALIKLMLMHKFSKLFQVSI